MVCWVLAVLLAGTMARGDDDWLGQAAILITAVIAIVGPAYLFNYWAGRRPFRWIIGSTPSLLEILGVAFLPLLLTPLLTLLYALLESHRRYRRAVTVGLPIIALAPLALLLIIAPP
jgi:hypothetical protein